MGRKSKDNHDHEQGRSSISDGRLTSAIRYPFENITPAVDEHWLPEEPEEDEGDEADEDGPLVSGGVTETFKLLPHHILDSVVRFQFFF